jgi:hypothetical protein
MHGIAEGIVLATECASEKSEMISAENHDRPWDRAIWPSYHLANASRLVALI